jgi:hypothetical protein
MTGTVRVRNLDDHPYASVLVTDGEGDQHTMVTLVGPASVATPDAEVLARWGERRGESPDWATAWIRVGVERVLSYAAVASPFGAG